MERTILVVLTSFIIIAVIIGVCLQSKTTNYYTSCIEEGGFPTSDGFHLYCVKEKEID